jgi:hypothetical protein
MTGTHIGLFEHLDERQGLTESFNGGFYLGNNFPFFHCWRVLIHFSPVVIRDIIELIDIEFTELVAFKFFELVVPVPLAGPYILQRCNFFFYCLEIR